MKRKGKIMRKTGFVLLSLLVLLGITGCSSKDTPKDTPKSKEEKIQAKIEEAGWEPGYNGEYPDMPLIWIDIDKDMDFTVHYSVEEKAVTGLVVTNKVADQSYSVSYLSEMGMYMGLLSGSDGTTLCSGSISENNKIDRPSGTCSQDDLKAMIDLKKKMYGSLLESAGLTVQDLIDWGEWYYEQQN